MATLNITGVIIDSPVAAVTASTYIDHTPNTVRRTAVIVDSPDALTTATTRVDHIPVTITFTSQVIDSPEAEVTATVRVNHVTIETIMPALGIVTIPALAEITNLRADHPDDSVVAHRTNLSTLFSESTATTAGPSFYW